MKVNEYIYRNWANWNFAILKQLCEDEEIEWSEELIGYLKMTPTNTNWSLLKDFGIEPYESDEGESDLDYKLWFIAEFDPDVECNGPNNTRPLSVTGVGEGITLDNLNDLFANPNSYSVKVDDTEVPYLIHESIQGTELNEWINTEQAEDCTYAFVVQKYEGQLIPSVAIPCELTKDINVYIKAK